MNLRIGERVMKFNSREKRILSITLAGWGIFFIGSGLIMNANVKTIVNTKYTLDIQTKKIAEAQAKSNEIKLKDLEVEIDTPLSVNVKDYLNEYEKLNTDTFKELKLDTSLVNINQAGIYHYNIIYKKKIYVGKITVKAKELPNMTFTLKNLTIPTTGSISTNKRDYINEEISDEVYNNIVLDISEAVANQKQPGNYTYTITYKDTKYQGTITISEPIKTGNSTQQSNQPKEQTITKPNQPDPVPDNTPTDTTTTNQNP